MSTNGVKHLFSAADELKLSLQLKKGLAKTYIIAVGPKTAEAMTAFNIQANLVPQKYSGEGLLEALKEKNLAGKSIRIPRTSNAPPALSEALKARGADVEEIYVYESSLPIDEELKTRFYQDLTDGHIDALLFGSGLSVKNIFKMLTEKVPMAQIRKTLAKKVTVVAIGPTTAEALNELNVKVDVIPANYLFDNALDALAMYWDKAQSLWS
jgi:uroporphyrinogen-III synthase